MKASNNGTSFLEAGFCRCCGNKSIRCRIISQEYESYGCNGQKEVFVDMLKDTFGIELTHSDQKDDSLVCTSCVGRLRGAFTFKMLVLTTEQDFLGQRNCMSSHVPNHPRVALELVEAELLIKDEVLDNMPDGLDDELTPELLAEYKQLELANLELEMALIKDSNENLQINNTVKEHHQQSLAVRQNSNRVRDGFSSSDEALLSNIKKGLDKSKQNKRTNRKFITKKIVSDKTTEDNLKRVANVTAIIKHTYAVPFKCRYSCIMCYYCKKYFLDPDLLRQHTITHDPNTFRITKNNTKIDIQRIDCRLCSEKIVDLNACKRHLLSEHGKHLYLDAIDLVLPFVLETDTNRCVVCSTLFQTFHDLNKHMSEHFSNFVCEKCGLGFIDKTSLEKHKKSHSVKIYPCEFCEKTFKNRACKAWHTRTVHDKVAGTTCKICGEYMLLHEKAQHIKEVHGKAAYEPCFACDKVFENRWFLSRHLRRDHKKQYRHKCQVCDRRFYTSQALKHHMPTHTGVRDQKCTVCGKCFPRAKTLKQHMRIHENDRRYKCNICGQAFVQNCSLKGHMKSKHPECAS